MCGMPVAGNGEKQGEDITDKSRWHVPLFHPRSVLSTYRSHWRTRQLLRADTRPDEYCISHCTNVSTFEVASRGLAPIKISLAQGWSVGEVPKNYRQNNPNPSPQERGFLERHFRCLSLVLLASAAVQGRRPASILIMFPRFPNFVIPLVTGTSVGSYAMQTWRVPYTSYTLNFYFTIPYYTMPYFTIPYYTVPHYSISYYTIPYFTTPYHTICHILPKDLIMSPNAFCRPSHTTSSTLAASHQPIIYVSARRAQYSHLRNITLNHIRDPPIIQGKFSN